MTMYLPRRSKQNVVYVDPSVETNAGLWSLFTGATIFLGFRLWVKITRKHGLWWDDYILIASWLLLGVNDSLISLEFATGYVTQNGAKWDDRMHILINITSSGTLIGQALTKTAFGITLLKLTNRLQQNIIWFCIITMNAWMISKVFIQWGKTCGKKSTDMWYRLDFCVDGTFRDRYKAGGNVYNIIMDYFFAIFPWWITWKLDMRRAEKVGLCVAMSLGAIIATVAAVRQAWKDNGNSRDPYYYWRNGMSNVWYSSEIAGTIMVQCIPLLRPFLRDVHNSRMSNRLNSSADLNNRRSFSWANKYRSKRISKVPPPLQGSSGGLLKNLQFGFKESESSSHLELSPISEKNQKWYVDEKETNDFTVNSSRV